jgi:lysyl-tRNA synthetase class 2
MLDALDAALERAGIERGWLSELRSPDFNSGTFAEAAERYRQRSERAAAVDWPNLGRGLRKCHGPGERVFVAYEYLAEPFLSQDYRSADGRHSRPVFVMDHPTDVSPLARRKNDDPTLTERFEVFVDSREIGNAFSELNDPDDQAERFRAQVDRKSRGVEETMDYDEDYIRALQHGMPPAAGFGVGIDRLTMMLASQSSIRDVIAFPLLRPESRG